MLAWRLLDRQKAWAAIQHIATISDERIDQLFDEYKAYFTLAIAQEPDKKMRAIRHDALVTLAEKVANIKQDKNQLQRLLEFRNPGAAPTQFFAVTKDKGLKSHPDIKKIEGFFTLYDNFYTSLYEDFPKRSAKALIAALKTEGRASKTFLEYEKMKADLLTIFEHSKSQLAYQQFYVVYTRNIVNTKYADKKDDPNALADLSNIEACERTIARLTAQVETYKTFHDTLIATDQVLAAILPNATQYCHNSANYAVFANLKISTASVEFTLRSAFPGDIKDPHGKTCDESSWAGRVLECRALLSKFAEEELIDGEYHYQVNDSVQDALEALKSESDRSEPYQTNFIDEILEKLPELFDSADADFSMMRKFSSLT